MAVELGFGIAGIRSGLSLGGDGGQSLVEFLLLLPVLFGMAVVLLRVNTAIQMSIVNQKFARAQTLFISHNSPVFPRLELQDYMKRKLTNQVVVGISENSGPDDEEQLGEYQPEASVQLISRNARLAPKRVKILNTVSLCSQSVVMKTDQGVGPVPRTLPELRSASAFMYCSSRLPGLSGGLR